jgi:hypothetical protein
MDNRRIGILALLLCGSAGAALAQDTGLSVTVGARAWHTDWTTFSYFVEPDPVTGVLVKRALTQVSAPNKLVLMPSLSARYGNFTGSLSGFQSTRFDFDDGGSGTRKEWDINVGYLVLPSLALTLGYKKVSQRDGAVRYEPKGPMLGLNASGSVSGPVSMYGNLGVGRLKTPPKNGNDNIVDFKATYRLAEFGLAYSFGGGGVPRLWSLTAGYRIQVLRSIDAFGTQDGKDTTQGLTFGALATF